MQKIQRDQTRSLRHPESGFSNQVLVSQTVLDILQLIFVLKSIAWLFHFQIAVLNRFTK